MSRRLQSTIVDQGFSYFLFPVIRLPKPLRPMTIAWPILLIGFDELAEFALLAAAFVVLAAVAY
jgi:hypothetical protein